MWIDYSNYNVQCVRICKLRWVQMLFVHIFIINKITFLWEHYTELLYQQHTVHYLCIYVCVCVCVCVCVHANIFKRDMKLTFTHPYNVDTSQQSMNCGSAEVYKKQAQWAMQTTCSQSISPLHLVNSYSVQPKCSI